MDSVARGVRFWQLVRLGVAGRARASLLGVFGDDVGRARMACGRCECGRRCARRVTQKVGVIQHSASRGNLGRQELVGRVVVWGRKQGDAGVWFASPFADCAFGVTAEVRAVVAELEPAFGSVRLTGRLATRIRCVWLKWEVRLTGWRMYVWPPRSSW